MGREKKRKGGNGKAYADPCVGCQRESVKIQSNYEVILGFVREKSRLSSRRQPTITCACADHTSTGLKTRRFRVCFDGRNCLAVRLHSVKTRLREDIGAYKVPKNVHCGNGGDKPQEISRQSGPFPIRGGRVTPRQSHGHE